MRLSYMIFLIAFSLIGYSQENKNEIIKKYNLPKEYKEYLKVEPFVKMLERVERDKLDGIKNSSIENAIEFEGFTNRKSQECSFTEHIYSFDKKNSTQLNIEYYYKNQHLYQKFILIEVNYNQVRSIWITFHPNAQVRSIESRDIVKDVTTQIGKWDENGNSVDKLTVQDISAPVIKSKLGINILSIPDVSKIKMLPQKKLDEIKIHIGKLSVGSDFNKVYDDFTSEDWKRFNLIRDYLNTELTMILYKGKDVYWDGGVKVLTLIDEYGNSYFVGNTALREEDWVSSQTVYGPEEGLSTFIKFSQNGNVSYIRQYMSKDNKSIQLGLVGDYREDGSVIREINLESEFKLTSYEVFNLISNLKGKNGSFDSNSINRYLNTNHGNIWEIPYYVSGVKDILYVNDEEKTVVDFFRTYTKEEYKKLYGDTNPAIIEKQQEIKILVFEDLGATKGLNP